MSVGGIAACSWNATGIVTLTNVTNNGSVTAVNAASGHNAHVGGIIGMVNPNAVVYFNNVTSAGAVSGSITNSSNTDHIVNAGALVGQQNNSTVYINSATITAACTVTVSNTDSAMTNNVGVYVANPVRTLIKSTKCVNQSNITLSGNGDSGYVAQVEDYDRATLTGTIEAANNGATITLNSDVTLSSALTIPEGREIVLDLNGKTITGTASNLITNKGTLTVKDSSSEKAGTISTSAANMFKNTGSLMIENGTYTSEKNNLIYNDGSSAIVIIKDGSFTAANPVVYNKTGSVTIDGGTFTASASGNVVSNQGSMKINGGTFTGGISVGGNGSLAITGGTFSANPSGYVDSTAYTVKTNEDSSYTVTAAGLTSSQLMQVKQEEDDEEPEEANEAEEIEEAEAAEETGQAEENEQAEQE